MEHRLAYSDQLRHTSTKNLNIQTPMGEMLMLTYNDSKYYQPHPNAKAEVITSSGKD
jgi:hypothetical protein